MGTSGFDQAMTKFWDWNNKGVSEERFIATKVSDVNLNQRQWKDIRPKYVENEEE